MIRRFSLGSLFGSLNAALVLLALAVLAWAAIAGLWRLADEQAVGRALQATTSAQLVIARVVRDTGLDARLLSERPTLGRLAAAGAAAELGPFLERFRAASQLDGVALLRNDRLLAGQGLASPEVPINRGQATALLRPAADGDGIILVAYAPIADMPDTGVLAVRRLGAVFAEGLSGEVGLPATISAAESAGPRAALRAEALAADAARARLLPGPASYVAAAPIRSPDGATVGVIEVALPAEGVTGPVGRLIALLVPLALTLAALTALANLLAGRLLGRPLDRLTAAAATLGRGDLDRPIPHGLSAEIDTLATAFEDMRLRLRTLTADLHRQQAEREAVLSGIVEGVYSVDRERRVRYINQQAAALLGVAAADAIGRFCGDLLSPEPVGGVRPCEEHCPIVHARFRQGARAIEHLRGRDGRVRTVVITSAPLVSDMQVQVLRDETELETSRRLRDTIMANISHEFRTPLSAQLASIELLLDQLPELSSEQIGQLVRSLQRSTLRLTQLVDNLLESARVEAGQVRLRDGRVALDEVVEDALELMRPLLDQRGQRVAAELPYPLPTVAGDASRLTQVLVNLLANAHKFGPPSSTIRIGAATVPGEVRLWVRDEGPGSPLLRDGARFERFVRAPGDEPEQSGVGLGLWICTSIIERHGGRISARSDSSGATVTISLPTEAPR